MAKAPADILEQLRAEIAESGLTGNALAKEAGIDERQVARFLRRERDLTGASLARIAAALGLIFVKTRRAARK
jgi:transcriptional regulator with XRE-family HTH domain